MEILSGGRAVSNNDVSLLKDVPVSHLRRLVRTVTELQESLQPGRGVLRTISIVTMRKQHHQPVFNIPLRFSGDYFSVNHNLSTVSEVSELGFPKAESVRVGLGVPVFEPENCVLRKMRASSDEVSDATSVRND